MGHVASTQGMRTTCNCGWAIDFSGLTFLSKREKVSAAHDAAYAHLRTVKGESK